MKTKKYKKQFQEWCFCPECREKVVLAKVGKCSKENCPVCGNKLNETGDLVEKPTEIINIK